MQILLQSVEVTRTVVEEFEGVPVEYFEQSFVHSKSQPLLRLHAMGPGCIQQLVYLKTEFSLMDHVLAALSWNKNHAFFLFKKTLDLGLKPIGLNNIPVVCFVKDIVFKLQIRSFFVEIVS
jgi:hypothetical protein